jgi:uncharacterized lipoprotein
MIRPKIVLTVALFASFAVLPGCKRMFASSCSKPQAYAQAQSLPPLRIPVGLDGPDTRAALKIPDLNEPEAPRGPKDPCLVDPPAFTTSAAPAAR